MHPMNTNIIRKLSPRILLSIYKDRIGDRGRPLLHHVTKVTDTQEPESHIKFKDH